MNLIRDLSEKPQMRFEYIQSEEQAYESVGSIKDVGGRLDGHALPEVIPTLEACLPLRFEDGLI